MTQRHTDARCRYDRRAVPNRCFQPGHTPLVEITLISEQIQLRTMDLFACDPTSNNPKGEANFARDEQAMTIYQFKGGKPTPYRGTPNN